MKTISQSRREFLKTLGRTTAAAAIGTFVTDLASSAFGAENLKKKQPNIIIIFTDDQGYGDLSCYGSKVLKTPNLDRMATEGMKFTNFYVSASVCTPSRAALMTGCYQTRVGLPAALFPYYQPAGQRNGKPIGLNLNEITIAEALKQAGYETCCVGKWHLGDLPEFSPTRQGFDEFFGVPFSNGMNPANTIKVFQPLPLIRNERVIEHDPDQTFLTKRYTEESIKFIERNKDKPFFLYLAHSMPHRAIYARKQFMERFNLDEKKLDDPRVQYRVRRDKVFPAAIEEIDWSVGEILETIKKLGIDDSTLIVFSCDNGPDVGSAGPLKGGKASCYEGGFRVPCIMRWTGTIPSARVCNEICASIDFMPTFVKLGGGKVPTDRVIDGKDIGKLIMGVRNAKSPHEAFFYFHQDGNLVAVRSGKWKLFVKEYNRWGHKTKELSLYDLDNDIHEDKDVAAEHPDVVNRLKTIADRFLKDLQLTKRPVGMTEMPKGECCG